MSGPETLPAGDVAAIRRAVDEYVRIMLAHDSESFARHYAEDAVLMPPGHPAVRGREAIRQWMSESPPVSEFRAEIDQIEGRADLAYVRGSYFMAFHPEGAPGPAENAGKSLDIRRRQPDGSWLIVVDIFNSDR